ncbi:MAG: ABC transporter ATP-binding protein [Saprospiraceae bacterium]
MSPASEPTNPMSRLFQYLKGYKKEVSVSVFATITNKLFDMMPPFLTAWLIDTVSGQVPSWIPRWTGLNDLWEVAIFITIITIIIFGFESFFEWMFKRGYMRLAQKVQHDLRLDAYNKLQSREIAYFEEQRTGNLMSMLNNDVNQLERFLNGSFKEIIQLIILVLVAGWALFSFSWQLGAVSMASIPFIIWGSFWYQKTIEPHYQKIRSSVGELSNRLENNISGIAVIKSFTAETYETQRVIESSKNYQTANFGAIQWNALYVPLIRMVIVMSYAAALLLGGYWVINGMNGFTIGSMAFIAMMLERLLWPITRLGDVFDQYERAKASSRRIFGLIDAKNQITNPANPQILPSASGNIQLKNISFWYKKGQAILDNIALNIQKGQTIGIAGPTGGGKTTLIKLLLRLYDVKNGSIEIEGIDIKNLTLKNLRQNIGFVSQEVYLFHGSIQENIAYGMPDASNESIINAAKKAQLHDFIATLPDAYETIVGERGIKLSGGQRQRLSIARAILKDAPILILDEATSAVDTETERAIQQNLHQLTQGKTALIIAHRLSTIRHADKIIVLKDGQISESGTHTDLLTTDGIYADLWKVQIGELAK